MTLNPNPEEVRTKNAIDRIWTENPCYGCRRIRIILRDIYQIHIGKRRLSRYMKEMGITAIYPGPNLSKRNLQHRTYPYLLRNIKPEYPNHVWGIDLTYIGMNRGWMYLVVIIDWASRIDCRPCLLQHDAQRIYHRLPPGILKAARETVYHKQ